MPSVGKKLIDFWWKIKYERPVRMFFRKLGMLFKSKEYRGLIKTTFKSWPWDYSYLLELEKAKIQEILVYHKKHNIYVNTESYIRDMKICVNLLDILITEGLDLDDYDGKENKHKLKVYVNIRNIDRFCKNEYEKEFLLNNPLELYLRKANHLYYMIRENKTEHWWI